MGISTIDMLKKGVHFGHRKSRKHPGMNPFVFTVRNEVSILDLQKTKTHLEEAIKFLQEAQKNNKVILFVGTKKQAKDKIKELADHLKQPYVIERWIGGAMTNFDVISKNIKKLKDLIAQTESGEVKKYTKKEQLGINQEIDSLEKSVGGLKSLTKLPDCLFVWDVNHENGAVKEAIIKNIPIVAVVDSDSNPEGITKVIPANDDAVSSVNYILNTIKDSFEISKKSKPE